MKGLYTMIPASDKDFPHLDVAVAAGVEWLDTHGPADWWDRIDIDNLDISESERCILGQVFAAEAAETWYFSGYGYALQMIYDTVDSGVDIGVAGDYRDFPKLTDLWTVAIENRRALVNA